MAIRSAILCAIACVLACAGCGGGGGATARQSAVSSGAVPLAPTAAPIGTAAPIATPAPVATARPSNSIPITHVANYAYWGSSGEPAGLTADWVAAHVSFVDAPPWFARPFKAAGGKYAVAYTDPFRVVVANHEPLWDLPEGAWFHDGGGARIWYSYGSWGVQNQLNPASPLVQAGYAALTRSLAGSAPYDFAEMDDVHFDRLGAFDGFNAWGNESTSDDAYDAAIKALIASSAIPILVNGLSNEDGHAGDVSGNTTFLDVSSGGINNEGCLQSTDSKSEAQWMFDANTLLATTQRGKIAVCWGISNAVGDARAQRLFFLASWWLTYDPQYSVAFPGFSSRSSFFVFPEYEIVPTAPRTSAARIADLRTGALYVREFAACYQAGSFIGSCAAIANPGSAPQAMPALAGSYRTALSVSVDNSFQGGTATWNAAIPSSLAPQSGVILLGP